MVGVVRASRRGSLFTAERKVDYAYVLKLILLSLAFAAVTISTLLTVAFFVAWDAHVDPAGTATPLDTFMPNGYAPRYAMSLMLVGALVTFAMSLIGYLDHINAGSPPPSSAQTDPPDDDSGT